MSEWGVSKRVWQDFPYIGLFMQATSAKYCYIVYEVVACLCWLFVFLILNVYIIGGPPPENFLVIFMQNGAILSNTNGYMRLDIYYATTRGLKSIDIWIVNEMYSIYNEMCRYSYVGYENNLEFNASKASGKIF